MVVRILIVVAVLMAHFGCGQSPETKDFSEGARPLGSEASVFDTVVLSGHDVTRDTWYEDFLHWFVEPHLTHFLAGAVLLLFVCAAVLAVPVLIWRHWRGR